MAKYKVLISGGSGFIGTNAVAYFLSNGFDVLNVDNVAPCDSSQQGYWKNVDIIDFTALKNIFMSYQPDFVLHLAAKTGMDVSDKDYFSDNVKGVENILTISNSIESVKRIVFTSSLLVCKNGYIPKSDTDYCPPNLYGESKVDGEKRIREALSFTKEWVIVRPTSVWGPWFQHSYRAFFKMISRGFYFHPGNKEIVKPTTYVGNAVHMMLSLLLAPEKEVNKKTFYLSDYPNFSTKAWATAIQKKVGARKIRRIPIPVLLGVAKIGDFLKKLGYQDPPLTSFRLNNMLMGGDYPITELQAVVGKLPFSLDEGVEQTIRWMSQQRDI